MNSESNFFDKVLIIEIYKDRNNFLAKLMTDYVLFDIETITPENQPF